MPFIYCLASEDEVLYVGRTTNLKIRECDHRKPSNRTSSRFIPEGTKWDMICLEEVAEEDASHAEVFYYHFLEPKYNKSVPGRTKAEYQRSEYMKEYRKKYKQTEAYKESRRRCYHKK
jgi:predicted GIY-YIG superfamily endonuclease